VLALALRPFQPLSGNPSIVRSIKVRPDPVVRVADAIVKIVLSPVKVGCLILVSPFMLFWLPELIANLRWRRANAGRLYLVALRSRQWGPFTENNVIPVLPPDVTVIWESGRRRYVPRSPKLWGLRRPASRPFLVIVRRWSLRVVPLHDRLKVYRAAVRRDAEVQARVKKLLEETLAGKFA
jgi:hypothetical protein